jgi:LemA protein
MAPDAEPSSSFGRHAGDGQREFECCKIQRIRLAVRAGNRGSSRDSISQLSITCDAANPQPKRGVTEDGTTMLFGLFVFGAIVLVVFSLAATYNGLVAAAGRATRAWNDLDTLLRQRHDEIPKLVEFCEPHLTSRAAVDEVLDARAALLAARQKRDAETLGPAETTLRQALGKLLALAVEESQLATSPALALLRQRNATLDTEIADRRDRYNEAVLQHNAAIARLPGSFVALLGGFRALAPLEFDEAARTP